MILPIGKGWSSLKKLTFIASVVNAWKTVTGAVANFIASKTKPVKVYFTLKPVQSGSGDPSPDNVRSISGHDSVTLKHSGEDTSDYDSYTATFPSTVYGGVVDWSKEKVVSQMELIDLGDLDWINTLTGTSGKNRFYAVLPKKAVTSDTSHVNSVCTFLKLLSSGATFSCIEGHTIAKSSDEWRVYAYVDDYSAYTKQEFTTAVTGQKLAYTLETPIEMSISDADSIVPVIGENNIWVEEADKVTVQYQ